MATSQGLVPLKTSEAEAVQRSVYNLRLHGIVNAAQEQL